VDADAELSGLASAPHHCARHAEAGDDTVFAARRKRDLDAAALVSHAGGRRARTVHDDMKIDGRAGWTSGTDFEDQAMGLGSIESRDL